MTYKLKGTTFTVMTFRIKDQLHRTIQLKHTPKRIVSLVPSQTELLFDLGLKDSVVGVTKFCVHPKGIKKEVQVVGGTKQIHLDKIKALNPDIILCNKEENTKAIVKTCKLICPVHVSDIFTIHDSLELIEQYGEIFNKGTAAKHLVEGIRNEARDFKSFIKDHISLNTVYFIWKKPWMVAANDTFINHLLQLNKFKNAFEIKDRYPEITLNRATINENVDLVLLSSEPYPFKDEHRKEIQKYYPKAKVLLVDGEMFSWYGSRLLKAFKYFKNLRLGLEKNPVY